MDTIIDELIIYRDNVLKGVLDCTQTEIMRLSGKYTQYSEMIKTQGFTEEIETAKISENLKKTVLNNYRNRCAVCGLEFPAILHMHHIIKRSDKGHNTENNIIPLCPNCHAIIHGFRSCKSEEVSESMEQLYGKKIVDRIFNLSFMLKR